MIDAAVELINKAQISDKEKEERIAVVVEACSWLNTPYHNHGRIKGAGTDCAMFVLEVFQRCGITPAWDPGYYAPDWHLHMREELYLSAVEKFCSKVESPLPGDIALFQWGRAVSHSGIILAWPNIIHAYKDEGVIYEDATYSRLCSRLHGCWSFWRK